MEELVEQFARVAGSLIKAMAVLVNRIASIWVHPKIAQP
jgi:hypothetical protein